MTGPYADDEEEESYVVLHYDGGENEPEGIAEPEYTPAPFLQRYRYWLYATLVLGLVCAIAYGFGAATYDPPPRLPRMVFGAQDGLFGTNASVAGERDELPVPGHRCAVPGPS